MSYKRASVQTSQSAALAPLGSADLALFQQVIDVIAPDWTVELQGICAHEASLIVVPDSGDDVAGPSFVVSREAYGFKLDRVRWDVMTEIGLYSSLPDVLAAIRFELSVYSANLEFERVTIH